MPHFAANLSLLFREYPLLDRFGAARAAGFEAVEIQFPYELSIDDIRRELDINELDLVLINVPAGDLMQGGDGLACVPGREQLFRLGVMEALRYAEALDVSCVNVLAGRQPQDKELLECLQTLSQNLRYAAEAFQSIGVTTTFEAINTWDMPRFMINTMAHMQEMREAVDHPTLKMQFDCYHMTRMGEDLMTALRENLDGIGHIQFADVPGRGQPGTGKIDYPALFNQLDRLGYHGYCGAEYHPTGHTLESLGWFEPYRGS
ncbi:hydroxypyruvate isomerase [Fluviicoccus keumensis]|uniref:Hydroxypyruvate isomerase n=1 Tax=Fluviicoccus keumensis TaxID=1435465 RepID=A0A4Q7YM63_9GAMM|nr:TIM barrel protein [Fluviicoccus keumensis]RZU38408.1 hydroxypyruvate isomerase [Fluviicoccus keumensis]